MKVVALISGGKDSCYNLMHCVRNGHEIVALANLMPEDKDELDSFMFQTVGHDVISMYSQALGLPLYRRTIKGTSLNVGADYRQEQGDEVEDLYQLLKDVKIEINYDAVSSGAILSNYQRVRVENVCSRLGVQSLAYLWQRNQEDLLQEMIASDLTAILIKVASLGLTEKHLGKTLHEMQPHLMRMKDKYGLNVCGEGGEYETLVLDCPLFVKKIVIDNSTKVVHSNDAFAPVVYMTFSELHLEEKVDVNPSLSERMTGISIAIPSLLNEEIPNIEDAGRKDGKEDKQLDCDLNWMKNYTEMSYSVPSFYENKDRTTAWCSNLICGKVDSELVEESTRKTMDKFIALIKNNGYDYSHLALVHLFCSNMDDFGKINSVYSSYFPLNPPARVCVQASLPSSQHFRMDANLSKTDRRETLHVQSISYWAPANIGPYSQSVKIHSSTRKIYFSGSIAMQPSSMKIIETGFVSEAMLSLKHVHEVSKVMAYERDSNEEYGSVTCYVTDERWMRVARDLFCEHQSYFSPTKYQLNILCVSRLPRNAMIEWHVNMRVTMKENEDEDEEKIDQKDSEYDAQFNVLSLFDKDISSVDCLRSRISSNRLFENTLFCRVFYLSTTFHDEAALLQVLRHVFHDAGHTEVIFSMVPVLFLVDDTRILLVGET